MSLGRTGLHSTTALLCLRTALEHAVDPLQSPRVIPRHHAPTHSTPKRELRSERALAALQSGKARGRLRQGAAPVRSERLDGEFDPALRVTLRLQPIEELALDECSQHLARRLQQKLYSQCASYWI